MKFILALILLGLVSFGAYFLGKNQATLPQIVQSPTQTPDPTANWKTYTNNRYGFSLKYPTTWSLEETTNPAGFIYGATPELNLILKSPNNLILEIAPASNPNLIQGEFDFSKSPIEEIIIGGVRARKQTTPFIGIGGIDQPNIGWRDSRPTEARNFDSLGKQIIIRTDAGTSAREDLTIAEKILSTFKFTD